MVMLLFKRTFFAYTIFISNRNPCVRDRAVLAQEDDIRIVENLELISHRNLHFVVFGQTLLNLPNFSSYVPNELRSD